MEVFVVIKEKGYNKKGRYGYTVTMYKYHTNFEGKPHFIEVLHEDVQKLLGGGRKTKEGACLYESKLEILERLDKAGINYSFALA